MEYNASYYGGPGGSYENWIYMGVVNINGQFGGWHRVKFDVTIEPNQIQK